MSRAKWIPLQEWAQARYSPVPSIHTLRRWCRENQIHPPADKVGAEIRVLETAEKVGAARPDYVPLLQRLGA